MTVPPRKDDDKLREFLLNALVGIPMVMWIAFIVVAGFADHSATEPAKIDGTIRTLGVASGTALAVVAGSFLGIQNALRRAGVAAPASFRAAFGWPSLSVSGWASAVYLLGVVAAFVIWLFDGNKSNAVDVIQTAAATLVGFGIGALKAATSEP